MSKAGKEVSGFRAVACPLLGLEDATHLLVAGNADAKQLVLFCAGYPDDQRAFKDMAKRLSIEEDCLVGLTCLPEFDTDGTRALKRAEGYSFDESAQCFQQAVRVLQAQTTNAAPTLTIVCHDWGVCTGVIYANRNLKDGNPDRLKRAVLFDVLPPVKAGALPKNNMYTTCVHMLYQSSFAMVFVLSRLSLMLSQLFFALCSVLIFGVFGRWLNPVGSRDGEPGKGGSIKRLAVLPRVCYPYYHMFRELLTVGMKGILGKDFGLPDLTECPVLFLYGTDKNTMFHTPEALLALDAADGSAQMGVRDAGHWLYLHQPEACYQRVRHFVVPTETS